AGAAAGPGGGGGGPAPVRGRRRQAWRLGLLWLALVVAVQGLGWWRLERAERLQPGGEPLELLVLQPAIPTRRKFEFDQQQTLLRRLDAALGQAERLGVQALLLPEGALPLGQELPQVASVQVLSGGFRQQDTQLRSALLLFPAGEQRHTAALDKHRLVPLGEWIPGGELLAWAGLSAVGGLNPGAPSRLLARPQGPLGVVICYELADGTALAAATRDGAGWLLASANLDPYPLLLQQQFRALAQLRALEVNRWLVSAANTGPSLVVDGAGVVRQQLAPFESGELLARLQVRQGLTGYGRWGELPLLLLLAGSGTWIWRESKVRQS
ncbi:MAG: apolipoprotein N-acyltransferase, partial [Synechococcaceae bacterium WBB_3_034]|nr:apolipoprotein N-acyltransferase [Synechococcaceae bacterium WBB_3_034]